MDRFKLLGGHNNLLDLLANAHPVNLLFTSLFAPPLKISGSTPDNLSNL